MRFSYGTTERLTRQDSGTKPEAFSLSTRTKNQVFLYVSPLPPRINVGFALEMTTLNQGGGVATIILARANHGTMRAHVDGPSFASFIFG